jgi:hypothetical protein
MSLRPEASVRRPRALVHWIAVVGLILSFAGLALAVAAHVRREPSLLAPPRSVREQVVDAAGTLIDKLRGKEPPAPAPSPLRVAASVLGLVGLLAGSIGWIRRVDHRLCGAAAVVGLAAITWQWVLVGIVIGVVLLLVLAVHGALG